MATLRRPSSWYIRGDVGYGVFDRPTIIEENRFGLSDTRIDDSWAIGGGVGYYFSKSVRADVTWDHRFESDVHGFIPTGGNLVSFPGDRKFGLKSEDRKSVV